MIIYELVTAIASFIQSNNKLSSQPHANTIKQEVIQMLKDRNIIIESNQLTTPYPSAIQQKVRCTLDFTGFFDNYYIGNFQSLPTQNNTIYQNGRGFLGMAHK